MKKYFLLFLMTSLSKIASSQTYREAFDKSDYAFNNGQGNSFYSNANSVAGVPLDGEADLMHSYLIMYRATQDKHYLDKFIIHAKRVQERRDDNIKKLPATAIVNNSSCFSDVQGINGNSKSWSLDFENASCGWTVTSLYSGKIIFPMAEFIYMMKVEFSNDIDLLNTSLPEEANGIGKYINQYSATYDISEGLSSIQTYSEFAGWLEIRARETLDYLESNYWEPGTIGLCDYDNSISFGGYCSIVPHCTL